MTRLEDKEQKRKFDLLVDDIIDCCADCATELHEETGIVETREKLGLTDLDVGKAALQARLIVKKIVAKRKAIRVNAAHDGAMTKYRKQP